MIGMCDVAQVVRNNKHTLSVVASCVRLFLGDGRCIGILAVVECCSVFLVEVNEYPAATDSQCGCRNHIPCGT
jgi:hypothetical protein